MAAATTPKIPENPQIFTLPDTGISAAQLRSIEMLLTGMSVTQIAQKIGIDRKTLYEWRKNPVFQAEYNRRMMEASEAMDQRLRRLSDKAVDVVEKHLSEGSLQAATALLKLVAAMPKQKLSTNPQILLRNDVERNVLEYFRQRPFEEKRLGSICATGPLAESCVDIYEFYTRKYGIQNTSEFDVYIDEMDESARNEKAKVKVKAP